MVSIAKPAQPAAPSGPMSDPMGAVQLAEGELHTLLPRRSATAAVSQAGGEAEASPAAGAEAGAGGAAGAGAVEAEVEVYEDEDDLFPGVQGCPPLRGALPLLPGLLPDLPAGTPALDCQLPFAERIKAASAEVQVGARG